MSLKRLMLAGLIVGSLSALGFLGLADEIPQNPDGSEVIEDTPVVVDQIERPKTEGVDRPWRKPDFSNQPRAIGYSADTFKIPDGMESRVAFWRDIYVKHSTDQGLLHDSRYVEVVYRKIDFKDIQEDTSLSEGQKIRARKRRVDDAKKEIQMQLARIEASKEDAGPSEDDLRVVEIFKSINEKNKFREASRRGRLRFQLGQSDRTKEGIYQSGRHLAEMEEIFRREGLPLELTRLPFVESSFNLKARSRVGASGIWQFMRSAARPYLRMDAVVDERNDPLRATVAAARLLRFNYGLLGNWPLAVTAYNHGPHGVARLVKRYKTDQLSELTDVRRGRFGFASANFYASFLAALRVEQEAVQHYGPMQWMPELRGAEVRLSRPISVSQLLSWFDGSEDRARLFNPHIRSHAWSQKSTLSSRTFVRVPLDKADVVNDQLKNSASKAVSLNR